MKRCCLILIASLLVGFLGVVFPLCAQDVASSTPALSKALDALRDVNMRGMTLKYLGDPRSAAYFKAILADFPVDMREVFRKNVTGSFKSELFANYSAKSEEVTDQLLQMISATPAAEDMVMTRIGGAAFPKDLGYLPFVKKLYDKKKFQASQADEPAQNVDGRKSLDAIKIIFDRLTEESRRDLYVAMDGVYGKMSPKDFPIHWFDTVNYMGAYVTEGQKVEPEAPQGKKKWTYLIFSATDNNMELPGLKDINGMERVGSNKDLNIVVQIDRQEQGERNTLIEGNWVGARRFFITRDKTTKKISSRMVGNLGKIDSGDKRQLVDFLKWGITTYPAEKYVVIIDNHGSAWKGIAFDEESGNHFSLPDLAWAFGEAQKSLAEVNGGAAQKFAVIGFDACLMGTIEVAYELRNVAEFMVASEESQYMSQKPHAIYFKALQANPAMTSRDLAKLMGSSFVQSYTNGGTGYSWAKKRSGAFSITQSVIDLGRIEEGAKLMGTLAESLLKNFDFYSALLSGPRNPLNQIRRYSDETMVDMLDLVIKLWRIKGVPPDVKAVCKDIIRFYGYPIRNDRLSRPITIRSDKPGFVVWGVNGWKTPPDELCPSGSQLYRSRFVITRLSKTENGGWICKIGPFAPYYDQIKRENAFIEELNYELHDSEGNVSPKHTVKEGTDYLMATAFPASSPLVFEGHTQGMGDSRGLSIYFPFPADFVTKYQSTAFARDTKWAQLIAKWPVFKRTSDVLLAGAMTRDSGTLDSFAQALTANGVSYQVLWNPRMFGTQVRNVLRSFAANGVLILDGLGGRKVSDPSAVDCQDLLDVGGHLMIAAANAEQDAGNRQFLEDYLKFSYREDDKDALSELTFIDQKDQPHPFSLNGQDCEPNAGEITVMETAEPGKILAKDAQGRGAGIGINTTGPSGKPYSAAFLGFRFEAVDGVETRKAFLKAVLDLLLPGKWASQTPTSTPTAE